MHTCITAMLFCVKEIQGRNRFIYCSIQGDSQGPHLAAVVIAGFSCGALGVSEQHHSAV